MVLIGTDNIIKLIHFLKNIWQYRPTIFLISLGITSLPPHALFQNKVGGNLISKLTEKNGTVENYNSIN